MINHILQLPKKIAWDVSGACRGGASPQNLQKVTKKVTSFMNTSMEDQTTPNSYYYEIKSKSLSYKIIYKYI